MADKVLFNVAGGIISSVAGPLAAEEVKLFWGVKEELEKLKDTVSTIKAVLLDAEERRLKSHAVNNWLEKLNDILYKADDLLDAISTDAQRRELMARDKMAKKVLLFFCKSIQPVYDLRIAHKIKAIRGALDAIAADMRNFNFVSHPEETPVRFTGRDSTNSVMPDYKVVGRDDDKMKIIEQLVDTNVQENVSILPIVGIGGLGKTTLAQQVYNDEKIQTHFELRMWICVSDPFDVEDIVGKILEYGAGKKSNCMDIMIKDLKEKIDRKKYLLVLDDVWNENPEQWSKLKRLLMGGSTGSKILITTRSKKVAEIMFQGEPYSLKDLGKEASMDLLKQVAFRDGEWPKNSSFQDIGREIIRKCAGVPLAVKTVGRFLNSKNTEMEWLNFLNNELSTINQDVDDDILPTLKLSYNKLPSHVKHCFAYCSLYPKDYDYEKATIINQWIAHGFIQASSINQCLEDDGNDYFMALLWRNFFQDPQTNDINRLTICKMHDLMHDLAKSVMTGSLITTSNENEWNINEKTRHLSICGGPKFSIEKLVLRCKGRMIRTFLCPEFKDKIDCELIFSSFKFLRVLNLSNNDLEHVPNTIGKLKHLRYLDLSWNEKIKVMPHSFTKLVNLQFLDLKHCMSLEKLPRDIKNLVNLRHLDLNGCQKMTYLPCGLGQLTNLQLLTQFWIDLDSLSRHSANFSELKELNKLKGTLEIWNLKHSKDVALEYKDANIKGKTGLEGLILNFSLKDEVHDNDLEDERLLEGLQPHANLMKLEMDSCRSVRLPSWILSITSLVELRLDNCPNCQYLPRVNQLRSLKGLYLIEMNALDYIFDDDGDVFSPSSLASTEDFFPSLSTIWFVNCPNLKGWWRDSSLKSDCDSDHHSKKATATPTVGHHTLPSFPRLSKVDIDNCPLLTFLPLSPHIESLWLQKCSSKLLQQIMMMKTPAGTTTSTLAIFSSAPLSKLKTIHLWNLSDLETLQEEWLKNLTSLETLSTLDCPKLKSLSLGIQHLTALKYLTIVGCPEFELPGDEHGMCWQGLKSLFTLEVGNLPKWVSLPLGLQHVSTLRFLRIFECENLTTILESIHNWKSLERLYIRKCPSLTELPKEIHGLSSLRCLEIIECPILFQRYERDVGPDWPKIAHIPEVAVAKDYDSYRKMKGRL